MKDKGAKSSSWSALTLMAAHVQQVAHSRIAKAGCRVVGEEYFEFGHTQFQPLISRIKAAKPDVIYS